MIDSETGIWSLEEAKQSHFFDEALAAAIVKHVEAFYGGAPTSTADLGCGKGYYVEHLRNVGWDSVYGFEGTPNIGNISVIEGIKEVDLGKPLPFILKYEFTLSLELGEHVPRQHEQQLLDNIALFAQDTLLLSWAVPGQAGVGHVNCRTNDYIIEQMTKRGFEFDIDTSLKLRKASTLPWFANTLMWFDRRISG